MAETGLLEPDEIRLGRDDGAGPRSTLHGVVFAILCPGPAVCCRRGAALRSGREIVSASRLRRIDSTPTHHALAAETVKTLENEAARRIPLKTLRLWLKMAVWAGDVRSPCDNQYK